MDWAGSVSLRDRKNRLPEAEDGTTSRVSVRATAHSSDRAVLRGFMVSPSFPGIRGAQSFTESSVAEILPFFNGLPTVFLRNCPDGRAGGLQFPPAFAMINLS